MQHPYSLTGHLWLLWHCKLALPLLGGKSGVELLFIYVFIYLVFLVPHPKHMEVPRLGVESEL